MNFRCMYVCMYVYHDIYAVEYANSILPLFKILSFFYLSFKNITVIYINFFLIKTKTMHLALLKNYEIIIM